MAVRLVGWYTRMFNKRPVVTQVITAGTLTTSGDIIAQLIENRPTGYSFRRTAVMSCFGFCYFGPIVSNWLILMKRLNFPSYVTIAVDQAFLGPCLLAGFLTIRPLLFGHSMEYSLKNLRGCYFNYLRRSYTVWIPAQTINFYFIPHSGRYDITIYIMTSLLTL
uniref:Mitochondrial inner membrane protein Mpv17 n=1 Tax=Ciona intestinalis TaxID=7719 RepID=F6S8K0_CIOIN